MSENLPVFNDRYKQLLEDPVGSGAYGKVYLCEDISTNKKVVLKILFSTPDKDKNERKLMSESDHRFIIKYYDSFFYGLNNYSIVMEYCENGDLARKIKLKKETQSNFDDEDIFLWMHEMIEAECYLNSLKIIHRDIKPSNIFLTFDEHIKLGDLGSARTISESENFITTYAGTYAYMSPEIRAHQHYSYNTDIWSIGCVTFELITLDWYFQFLNENKNPTDEIQTKEIYQLTNQMLQANRETRPEAKKMREIILDIKSSNPNYGYAFYKKAKILHDEKKYEDAIKIYSKIEELNPNDALILSKKGICLSSVKKHEDAIKCFDRAIEINPFFEYAYNNKGNSLRCLKKYEDAIKCYDKAIEIDLNFEYAYSNKGNCLLDLKKYDQAFKCFDKAIEINPSSESAYNDMGNCFLDLKKYDEAVKYYDRAIEINPNYEYAYNGKGNCLHNLEIYDEAIECYEKAIEKNSDFEYAYNNMGNCLFDLKLYDEAIECYDRAIQINPCYEFAIKNKKKCLDELKKQANGQAVTIKKILHTRPVFF